MCSFRKSFRLTPEEEAEVCRDEIRLHEERIGYCSTCINLIPSTGSGLVTDDEKCRLGKNFFKEKACCIVNHDCDWYVEDRAMVDRARARLVDLFPARYTAEDEVQEFTKEQYDRMLKRLDRKE